MIVGFLGTVIGIERAVALKKTWTYGAPIFAVLSAIAQLFTMLDELSQTFAVISSAILFAIFCSLWWRQHESYLIIIGFGAALWFVGNSLWLVNYPYFIVAAWWAGFLVLTITGERLELSRFRSLPRGNRLLLFCAIAVFVVGLSRISVSEPGSRVAGAALAIIALWLLRHRVAHDSHSWPATIYGGGFDFWLCLAFCGRDALGDLCGRFYRRISLRCHASFNLFGIHFRDDLRPRSRDSALGHGCFTFLPEVVLCACDFASCFLTAAYLR